MWLKMVAHCFHSKHPLWLMFMSQCYVLLIRGSTPIVTFELLFRYFFFFSGCRVA